MEVTGARASARSGLVARSLARGRTRFSRQVAAQTLRIPYEDVMVAQPDTQYVPNSGPTVASRTAMIVGKLVERAAMRPGSDAASMRVCSQKATLRRISARAATRIVQNTARCESEARYERSGDIYWDDERYPRRCISRVCVGRLRGRGRGRHAYLLRASDGLLSRCRRSARCCIRCLPRDRSRAAWRRASATRSMKKCVWQNGHMANNQMTNYIMPTSADLPPIHVLFEEMPCVIMEPTARRVSASCRWMGPRRRS